MKARITLENQKTKERRAIIRDWEDSLIMDSGDSVKVKHLSVYLHAPLINGEPFNILHMLSKSSFIESQ